MRKSKTKGVLVATGLVIRAARRGYFSSSTPGKIKIMLLIFLTMAIWNDEFCNLLKTTSQAGFTNHCLIKNSSLRIVSPVTAAMLKKGRHFACKNC
jgi:hypothetical protein